MARKAQAARCRTRKGTKAPSAGLGEYVDLHLPAVAAYCEPAGHASSIRSTKSNVLSFGRQRQGMRRACRATWRFRLAVMTPTGPCKSPQLGRPLSLCLPVNKACDSGADACPAPEFASLRVAKESIGPNRICADRHRCDSLYNSRDVPHALHSTEAADEKLVPPVRRSASHAQAQLRDSGDGQPFGARFNRRPSDPSGADVVTGPTIGEVRRFLIGSRLW